ncbi:RING-type domain-containing protein [Aphelenchoides fujianensis]|nr:RING-type domain-containing protein [Aphelenchoides fujianensis]
MANKLEGLRDLVKIALSRDEPRSKRAQLELIKKGIARLSTDDSAEISLFRAELETAMDDAKREEQVRSLEEDVKRAAALKPSEAHSRLAFVRAGLDGLPSADAARMLLRIEQTERSLAVEQEVAAERERLLQGMRAAESLLASSDAPIAQLRRSAELLRTAAPRLETIGRTIEQLEDNNEQTAASKAHLADQLAALAEQFRNTQHAARDRMADARGQQHVQLTSAVKSVQAVLAAPDARPEQYTQHAELLVRALPEEEEAEGGTEDEDAALRRLVQLAADTRRALGERADVWNEFHRCRDIINDRHNAARELHVNVQCALRRLPARVEADRDTLQTALANRVKPLNAEMEAMATLVVRLEPLRVATSELQSVETDHKSLCDDYEKLLTTLRGELDKERQLRETAGRLRDEFARLEPAVESMSAADVRSLRADLLPDLAAQLDAIAERDRATHWRHVERQWPTDAVPDALRLRLQRVAETAAGREALATDEDAWAERRRQLDVQLAATNLSIEQLEVEQDEDHLADVKQKFTRYAEMLQAAAEWLPTSRLPDSIALVAQLDEEMSRTAGRQRELAARFRHQHETPNELNKDVLDINIPDNEEDNVELEKSNNDFNCAVCCCACVDPAVLDCCSHMFCFNCIERWILQRQVCPLCKKAIHEVKHNLEHTRQTALSWESDGKIVTARSPVEAEDYRKLAEREWPFKEAPALLDAAITKLQVLLQDQNNGRPCESIEQKIKELTELKDRMRGMSRQEVFNTQLFRFAVCYLNVERKSLIPSNSSVVLNNEFIRSNRKNLRLMWLPFVDREIRSITGLNTIDIDRLLDMTFDAMQFGGDRKSQLFAHLNALGVDHPQTFFENVHSFGAANQSMELYDACSRYG